MSEFVGPMLVKARPARITVVETVYHQPPDAQPATVAASRFGRALAHGADRRPDSYLMAVGADWTPLDCGRVPDCGLLVLVNEEGRFVAVQPTPAERAAAEAKVAEVGVGGVPFALLRPGESCRFEPAAAVELRCRAGSARVSVHLVPG